MADELARRGAEADLIGPEPFVALSVSTIKANIEEHAPTKHWDEWKMPKPLQDHYG